MPPTRPRVLFSNPPWFAPNGLVGVRAGSRWPFTFAGLSRPSMRNIGDYTPFPFFMAYAASYVAEKTNATVDLVDSIATRESYESYYADVEDSRPDFIFFESASPSWDHDVHVIRTVKRLVPEAVIAVCGPIAARGQQIFAQVPVDAVIRGEYEKGAVRVIEGARGVIDFDLLSEDEMDAAPWPLLHPMTWDSYWDANPRGQVQPQLQMWSSRGCPYKCIFCVWPAAMTGNDPDGTRTRRVRHYSAPNLRAFLLDALKRFPYRSVYFDDDTFNLGNHHVLDMCEMMAPFKLPWSAMCRADGIERSTWKAMSASGCFGVKLGFESGNQYVVDSIINKHLDLEAAADTVAFLKSLGMTIHGTFTVGLPGETEEQRRDTWAYIARLEALGMDTYQVSGCAEIEGAPLRTLAERGPLVQFPGAKVDHPGYQREVDGAAKLRALV